MGSPNSVLLAYCAVLLATAMVVGSVQVSVVPSTAEVARNVALPAATA
jgi:hypothetical protein